MNLQLVRSAPVQNKRRRRTIFQDQQERLKLLQFDVRKVSPDCYFAGELPVILLGNLEYVTRARWYISKEIAQGRAMSVILACLPQAVGGKLHTSKPLSEVAP